MTQVGFESTIPVFKWAKRVHALDRAAAVIGKEYSTHIKYDAWEESAKAVGSGIIWPTYFSKF
jgi:hypothetical protein